MSCLGGYIEQENEKREESKRRESKKSKREREKEEMTEISGLLFHTNSLDTYYTFVRHVEKGLIEFEICKCLGINDGAADYQWEYENNRLTVGRIINTVEWFRNDKVLNQLYTMSLMFSDPNPHTLKTRIIWKCLRVSDSFEEFNVKYDGFISFVDNPSSCFFHYQQQDELIDNNRLQRLVELGKDELEKQITVLENDVSTLEEEVEHQSCIEECCKIVTDHMGLEDVIHKIRGLSYKE